MKRQAYVDARIGEKKQLKCGESARAFAPSNIALIKYWGKRDEGLNLPSTSSLSIGLGEIGTITSLVVTDADCDEIIFNEKSLPLSDDFAKRIANFLDLFRFPGQHFLITTKNNFPTAAGLASSASGYAALMLALNQLYQWELPLKTLSQLARLGSGSACRSFWPGFVAWHAGKDASGEDCFAEALPLVWPEFCVGLLIVDEGVKKISSRKAMMCCQKTSPYYSIWPKQAEKDLGALKNALLQRDFDGVGRVAEANALAMHALMQSARPAIVYSRPETLAMIETVWRLRDEGVSVYFTQDAGPNLKLLFLKKELARLQKAFPDLRLASPFVLEQVILVNAQDEAIGVCEKQRAHVENRCHRAFSVFIFRETTRGLEVLLQQRAHEKYHGGGLWTNTCCSHPRPGEETQVAAQRRLFEEMGMTTSLQFVDKFHYQADFDEGVSEHEIDHVFIAAYDGQEIVPNPVEVASYEWILVQDLLKKLDQNPQRYTVWLKPALLIAYKGKRADANSAE